MNVLVAMSGGVDSAVTAHLLRSNGYNTWGVHMILNDEVACDINTRSCCSTKDSQDAREVAQSLGMYFDAIPMQSSFKKAVIDNFISEYAAGRTPIPCTLCNGYLKFKLLFDYAESAGFTHIATGHYARVNRDYNLITPVMNQDGSICKKDQTYYLWQIESSKIPRVMFPVGEEFCNKDSVREYADYHGIVVAQKPDSQNICFIPSNDYRKYLRDARPDLFSPKIGNIVDQNNSIVSTHDGYWNFSIGQRARIAGLPSAKYVVDIIPDTNTIVVADKQDGLTNEFVITDCNLHANLDCASELWIKINANSPMHKISNFSLDGTSIYVKLENSVRPSRGQAGVIYGMVDGKIIAMLGGGWIK